MSFFRSPAVVQFRRRIICACLFVVACFGTLVARFVSLQVVRHQQYVTEANDNRISVVPLPPVRGTITDRNGVVLAQNDAAYTLQIYPTRLNESLQQTIADLSEFLPISTVDIRRFNRALQNATRLESVPLLLHMTYPQVARFVVQAFRFPGVEVQTRMYRRYPLGEVAANVVGYVGRVSDRPRRHSSCRL